MMGSVSPSAKRFDPNQELLQFVQNRAALAATGVSGRKPSRAEIVDILAQQLPAHRMAQRVPPYLAKKMMGSAKAAAAKAAAANAIAEAVAAVDENRYVYFVGR